MASCMDDEIALSGLHNVSKCQDVVCNCLERCQLQGVLCGGFPPS